MKAFLEHFKHFRRNMLHLKTHSLLTMVGTEQTVSEKTRILGSLCPTYLHTMSLGGKSLKRFY